MEERGTVEGITASDADRVTLRVRLEGKYFARTRSVLFAGGRVTFDGALVADAKELLAKVGAAVGKTITVVLHPVEAFYGGSVRAEFTSH